MLQGTKEIFVHHLSLMISGPAQFRLLLKTLALIQGVVQLSECVGQLFPAIKASKRSAR